MISLRSRREGRANQIKIHQQKLKLFSFFLKISKSQKQTLSSHFFFINHFIKFPEAETTLQVKENVKNWKL
jgi:hypothetical protein